MKWAQPSIIVLLLFGFPFFQCDQTIDWDWLICDNFLVIKLDSDSSLNEAFGSDSTKTVPAFSIPIQFISQLKNPLSVLYGFFQGTSPFWRPPPS
jgi:hypothetical protein